MPSVAVVGAGELGGAIAHALAAGGVVSRVVLIDGTGSVAAGKALDIRQAGAVSGNHVRLDASGELMAVTGCAVIVVADLADPAKGEWRGDEGFALLTRLLRYGSGAPVVLAGTQQHDLLARAVRELGTPRGQVAGSAPEALASAVRAVIAAEVPCAPAEVGIGLLGRPGGWIIPWSEATVGGYALSQVLTQARLARLEARCARLWPPGPYVLGVAAARMAQAMVIGARSALQAFAVVDDGAGSRGQVASVPVHVGPQGIVGIISPHLSARDRVGLDTILGG